MAELQCPNCGEPVEPTPPGSVLEGGEEVAGEHLQPGREHMRCPGCGASLVRDGRDPASPWRLGEPG